MKTLHLVLAGGHMLHQLLDASRQCTGLRLVLVCQCQSAQRSQSSCAAAIGQGLGLGSDQCLPGCMKQQINRRTVSTREPGSRTPEVRAVSGVQ